MIQYAVIAQLVEQLICNHQVPSSNLGDGTIFLKVVDIPTKITYINMTVANNIYL